MNRKSDNCAGVELGSRDLHIAIYENGGISRVVTQELPEDLIKDGQVLSYQALGDLLRLARREHRIRVRKAALVLPPSACYCRRITTAAMSAEQLRFNLPYEFHEYIPGAKDDYFYDYALVDNVPAVDPDNLDLMAAAAPKQVIADFAWAFQHAGFRLKIAIPDEMALINLGRGGGNTYHSHCILDLGHNVVRMYMFDGDRFVHLRTLDYGLAAMDEIIAEHYNVDIHIAIAYRSANHENCRALPRCRELYNAIAVEVLKAVNFHRFSFGGKELQHIHCCGGGVRNEELLSVLRETLSMPLLDMSEFWPDLPADVAGDASLAASAVGAALQ